MSTQWPRWLTPNCISKPSAVRRSGIAMRPALLMRMSTAGWASAMAAAPARTESSEARSISTISSDAAGWDVRMSSRAARALA